VTVFALVLAAGSSTRFGGSNKLFERIPDGREVWRASFDAFAAHPQTDAIGLVASDEVISHAEDLPAAFIELGGSTRRDSCMNGLRRCPEGALVLVHDAARPFVSPALIGRVVDAALSYGAAIPVVPLTDTIKQVEAERVRATLDRTTLYRAQTPQAANREDLIRALENLPDATDEAAALEALGIPVRAVQGDENNVKITTMADLPRVAQRTVTGFGFDVHAFSSDPDRKLVLGGVPFQDAPGLDGHSDADVLLHALTDALLGSVGAGDIGQMFPNTDPAFQNMDSTVFLRAAVDSISKENAEIISADITVLAETPKLGDKREAIREKIAQELNIPTRRVNIKATTMEGLGAIGRKEGIAAMATVTVLL
jgi:2-C-methyl-D-erythritol 4-phosphate cytidylyltransferase/2-C-methyl-D-erythritol 2,4-cyclodiphosphate synthase